MLSTTVSAVKAILQSDPSLSEQDRNKLITIVRRGTETQEQNKVAENRFVRRLESSRRLGISPRTFDSWCDKGILKKIKIGPRTCGISEHDLLALITARRKI